MPLFEKPRRELGGLSCRSLIGELVHEEWCNLARRSCQRNNRALPEDEDALIAFDAIKYSITTDSVKRAGQLPDPSTLGTLTLAEINAYVLSRLQIRHWIAIGLAGVCRLRRKDGIRRIPSPRGRVYLPAATLNLELLSHPTRCRRRNE